MLTTDGVKQHQQFFMLSMIETFLNACIDIVYLAGEKLTGQLKLSNNCRPSYFQAV